MELHTINEIITRQAKEGVEYLQFINAGTLSVARYALASGATDSQTPHREDEVYYVLNGRAKIDVDGEISAVAPGAIVFVGADVPHHFLDIEEDLSLLVFFAPEHQRTVS